MKIIRVACLILPFMALILAGCMDLEEEKTFGIAVRGYILQEQAQDSTHTFTPYLFVYTTGDYAISSLEVNKLSEENKMKFVKATPYLYHTDGSYSVKDPKELNGTYYFEATSENNDHTSEKLILELKDEHIMPELKVSDFAYDGNYVTATVKEIKNLATLGFAVSAYNKGGEPSRITTSNIYCYQAPINFTNGELKITYQISSTVNMDVDYAEIKVFAISDNSIQLESEAKTLAKNVKHFIEDEVKE